MKRSLCPLLVAACIAACSSSSTVAMTPVPTGDGGGPTVDGNADGDGGTSFADKPAGTRSCDPRAPRDPAPELLIGPTQFEKRIVAEIAGAQKSLEVFAYELDRDSVIDALVAAKKRGVDVRMVVDRQKALASSKTTLKNAGVLVQDSPAELTFSHAKTIIVDGDHALVLSGNFNDYTMTSERNYAVVDSDPFDVADLHAIFERDFAGSGDVDLGCTKLVVSPQNARDRLGALVDSAKTRLDLTIMYVTDSAMVAKLKAKKAEGVALRVLLADPAWIDSNTALAKDLGDVGIEVRYLKTYELHAKMIVADDAAFVGSENLSTNSLENNREIGVIVTNPEVVDAIETQIGKDWAAGVAP